MGDVIVAANGAPVNRLSARLADLGGGVVLQGSPAEFGRLIAAEAKKWGILIKAAGIKPV